MDGLARDTLTSRQVESFGDDNEGSRPEVAPFADVAAVHKPSRWERVWESASDVLIATALIWTFPLVLGVAIAVFAVGRWRRSSTR